MMSQRELSRFKKLLTFDDPRLPQMFNALGDNNRCNIFRLLHKQAATKFCVSDIAHVLNISVPTASSHLKILETAGLLSRTRSGQTVYYQINTDDRLVKIILKALT